MYISIHATLKTSDKILHACISISLSGQNFLFYLTPSHVHLLISNIDVAKRKLFWKCTRSDVGITLLPITLHFPGYHWLLNTFYHQTVNEPNLTNVNTFCDKLTNPE